MPVRRTARVAAWTCAALLGLAGAAAVATAAIGDAGSTATPSSSGTLALFGAPVAAGPSGTPSPSPSSGPGATGAPQDGPRRMLGLPPHGTFVTQGTDGTFRTLAVQRGTATAVSGTSISVRSADGFADSYAVTSSTRVVKDHQQVAIGEIKVNDTVMVLAEVRGSAKTALRIAERTGNAPGGGWTGHPGRRGWHRDGFGPGFGGPGFGSGSGQAPSTGDLPAPPSTGERPT